MSRKKLKAIDIHLRFIVACRVYYEYILVCASVKCCEFFKVCYNLSFLFLMKIIEKLTKSFDFGEFVARIKVNLYRC